MGLKYFNKYKLLAGTEEIMYSLIFKIHDGKSC
jgi:hypothetical protein